MFGANNFTLKMKETLFQNGVFRTEPPQHKQINQHRRNQTKQQKANTYISSYLYLKYPNQKSNEH